MYLLHNPLLGEPDRLWKAWFQPGSFIEYYPLEQTVQWCQWKLWGVASPFPYLVTNLVLHLTCALLLWHLFTKLGLKLAWLGGLIFAIHPLVVDSVGVSCELKNTLSLPPFLLAICFYLDFESTRETRFYFAALLLFLAAMLCKITMFFFPMFILLYAWWKRGRVTWTDGKAALPFFVISLVLGLLTLHVGSVYAEKIHYQSPGLIPLGGLSDRIALAGLSLAFYFGHSFLPLHPMPFYPLWKLEPLHPLLFTPWIGIAVVVICCWIKRHSWGRPALFALGFFASGLSPFLGLNKASYMCLSWVVDHFLYIPIIGLIGLVVAGLEQGGLLLPKTSRPFAIALLVLALLLLGFQTRSYAKLFSDHEKLWRYNLVYNPDMWLVRYMLANELTEKGETAEATEQLQEAVSINPDFSNAQMALGVALYSSGNLSGAIDALQACLKTAPQLEHARFNLAFILLQAGRPAEAVDQFAILERAHPDSAEVHYGLGSALAGVGRIPEGIAQLQAALKLDPNNAKYKECLEQIEASSH
jgi:hypothetical protein